MNIGEVLQTEVNSALVTFSNHNNDNSFLDCCASRFEQSLLAEKNEPVGICKNVPFKPDYAKYSVAFCYRYQPDFRLLQTHLQQRARHA